MASAWFGGKGPGWLAVVLSAIAVDRLFLPATFGGTVTREGVPFLFAFIVCALFANWFSSWRTRIEHSLRDARDQLDARVMQRTLELRSANCALLVEIQERKRAQEAVAVAQADLAHVNRVLTIGELTASLAHEVSQPLLAVLTSAGACERWLTNDPPDIEKARNALAQKGGHLVSWPPCTFDLEKGLQDVTRRYCTRPERTSWTKSSTYENDRHRETTLTSSGIVNRHIADMSASFGIVRFIRPPTGNL